MSQEPRPPTSPTEKPASLPEQTAGTPTTNYLWLGVGAVAFLILIVVAMVVITGGDVKETPAPTSLRPTAQTGKALFIATNCNNCHPAEGRAGGTGPRLSTTGLSDDSIRNTIRKGKGVMPANSNLTADELNTLVAYLRAIKPAS